MREFRSYIDQETGERVSGLFDMTPAQIGALEASRQAPVPTVISRHRFAQQLKKAGIITHAEALAFMAGTIPQPLSAAVAAIKDQVDREDSELLLAGAVEFRRDHALTAAIAASSGWSAQQTDDFFRAAGQL